MLNLLRRLLRRKMGHCWSFCCPYPSSLSVCQSSQILQKKLYPCSPTSVNNFIRLASLRSFHASTQCCFCRVHFRFWCVCPPAPAGCALLLCLPACLQGGAVANSDMDIVFHSSARDTIACLAKSAKGSIGLLRYDVRNIRID